MKSSRAVRVASFASGVAIILATVMAGTGAASARPLVLDRSTIGAYDGPVAVAIGDSIMEGHGLEPAQAWPALLAEKYGWKLANFASDGSGFVTVGDNGDSFADQVAVAITLHPSIVIVSGSSNDLGQSDASIAHATDATTAAIRAALPRAEILAVSPVWNETAEPAQLMTIDTDVISANASTGADDLDIGQPLARRPGLMQSDDMHPTAAGQKVIAAAVERALGTLMGQESN